MGYAIVAMSCKNTLLNLSVIKEMVITNRLIWKKNATLYLVETPFQAFANRADPIRQLL